MIYLYGLLEPGARPAPGVLETASGVTGPVTFTELPQGGLIHGPHDGAEILPRRRVLLAHTRVLETCLDAGALLPMRFGMSAGGVPEVAALLAAQADALTPQFQRVRGRVELGLRVSFPRDAALEAVLAEDPALRAERDRLRARPAGHFDQADFGRRLGEALDRRRTAAQRRLLAELRGEMVDHVLRAPEEDVQVLSAEVLLPAEAQEAFATRVESAARACGFAPGADPQLRLVGPVPPYHFVRLSLGVPAGEAA